MAIALNLPACTVLSPLMLPKITVVAVGRFSFHVGPVLGHRLHANGIRNGVIEGLIAASSWVRAVDPLRPHAVDRQRLGPVRVRVAATLVRRLPMAEFGLPATNR